MLRFIMLLALCALSAQASAKPTTLKNYALGVTLEEFRNTIPPPGSRGTPNAVVCSNDTTPPWWLTTIPSAVTCSFVTAVGGSFIRNDLSLSDSINATVDFIFFEGRLMTISAYLDSSSGPVIHESLVTKFGNPVSTNEQPFQVKSGAIFPQLIARWVNGTDEIVMKKPDLTTERMSVLYIDKLAEGRWKALQKPADIM